MKNVIATIINALALALIVTSARGDRSAGMPASIWHRATGMQSAKMQAVASLAWPIQFDNTTVGWMPENT